MSQNIIKTVRVQQNLHYLVPKTKGSETERFPSCASSTWTSNDFVKPIHSKEEMLLGKTRIAFQFFGQPYENRLSVRHRASFTEEKKMLQLAWNKV